MNIRFEKAQPITDKAEILNVMRKAFAMCDIQEFNPVIEKVTAPTLALSQNHMNSLKNCSFVSL